VSAFPLNIYLLLGEKDLIGVWLMNIRGTLAIIFGLMQIVIAALVLIFACCLCFNLFDIQGPLNGTTQSYYFHVLVLLFLGVFSTVSGLFLIYEWLESR